MIITNEKQFTENDVECAELFRSARGWNGRTWNETHQYNLKWDEKSGLVILENCTTKYFENPAHFAENYLRGCDKLMSAIFEENTEEAEEEKERIRRFINCAFS